MKFSLFSSKKNQIDPADDQELVEQATQLRDKHDYQRAEMILRDVISRAPKHVDKVEPPEQGSETIQVRYWDTEEFVTQSSELMQQTGKTVVWIPNTYAHAYHMLGWLAVERKDSNAAIKWLKEGLARCPGVPALMQELGQTLNGIGAFPDSLALFGAILRLPDLPPLRRAAALRQRAFALVELGDLDEAEASLRESLTYDPSSQNAKIELDYIATARAQNN